MNEISNQSDNLHKGSQRRRLELSFAPPRTSLLLCLALSFGAISPMVRAHGSAVNALSPNSTSMQQQNKVAKGVVTDSNGEPLIGVSVTEKGTNNAYVTNVNGEFELRLSSANAQVVVSYVGFLPQTLRATANMRIVLKEDSKALNEVVVVGYGAQKKANLTGAVTSVDVNKNLSSRPIADIGRGLQGVVPGMNIRVPTGEVGSDPLIKIRGQIGSIEGNNSPLILLDNVEIPSIQVVNPNDVESI